MRSLFADLQKVIRAIRRDGGCRVGAKLDIRPPDPGAGEFFDELELSGCNSDSVELKPTPNN